jgi:antirestriction protein ArdC
MSGIDVYQEVTDRMIRALDQGTVPWRRPWSATAGRPRSISTGRAYQGINTWLLGMTSAERGYRNHPGAALHCPA